jgi:hypothetical protein
VYEQYSNHKKLNEWNQQENHQMGSGQKLLPMTFPIEMYWERALKSLQKFVEVYKNVNIVLINTPHRYDLLPTSCVNKEVAKCNRQLKKIIKLYSNVDLMEVGLQRKHFTRHAQHLNPSGKELVSSELAIKIKQQLTKVKKAPIEIQWKEDCFYEGNSETQKDSIDQVESANYENHVKSKEFQDGEKKVISKVSLRTRKVPVKKSNDFLW